MTSYQDPSQFDRPSQDIPQNEAPGRIYFDEFSGREYYVPHPGQQGQVPVAGTAPRRWLIPVLGVVLAVLLIVLLALLIKTRSLKDNDRNGHNLSQAPSLVQEDTPNAPDLAGNSASEDTNPIATIESMEKQLTIEALSAQLTQVSLSLEAPTPSPEPNLCLNTSLNVDDSAWVKVRTSLYNSASSNASSISRLSVGDVLSIIGPSRCVDGKLMWYVQNTRMEQGWVYEADASGPFLDRINTVWACGASRLPTRLTIGQGGFVQEKPDVSNNLWSKPVRNSDLVGRIAAGGSFTVLDGPECKDDGVWWKVRSTSNGREGWTRESGSHNTSSDYYFVAPTMP